MPVTAWTVFKASFIRRQYFFEKTSALGPFTVNITGQRYECLFRNHFILAWMCGSDYFYTKWNFSAHCKSSEATAEATFWK